MYSRFLSVCTKLLQKLDYPYQTYFKKMWGGSVLQYRLTYAKDADEYIGNDMINKVGRVEDIDFQIPHDIMVWMEYQGLINIQ